MVCWAPTNSQRGFARSLVVRITSTYPLLGRSPDRALVMQFRPAVVRVERLAAKPEQIEEYGLITQPVTYTDSRARKFMERYGNETVELDAIPASAVRQLVRDAIERHMDPQRLELLRMVEQEEREGIRALFGGAA